MKKLFSIFISIVVFLISCADRDPDAVKAKLLTDGDFNQYIKAQVVKFSTDPTTPDAAYIVAEAEKNSFEFYQRLYKNYISKNLLTSQQLNEIIQERMAGEIKVKTPQ